MTFQGKNFFHNNTLCKNGRPDYRHVRISDDPETYKKAVMVGYSLFITFNVKIKHGDFLHLLQIPFGLRWTLANHEIVWLFLF